MTNMDFLLDFEPLDTAMRADYAARLSRETERGCEFTFANLYFWGDQRVCPFADGYLFFACFGKRQMYLFPLVGEEHLGEALNATLADASARGIPYCVTGMGPRAKAWMEQAYPDRFRFFHSEGSLDYVYDIDDLAFLAGKKYDGKRNHLRRFEADHPNAVAEPVCTENIPAVRRMAKAWFSARLAKDPDADMHGEERAISLALDNFDAMALEGLLLREGDEVLAFTIASRLREDTFDVHFEKARAEVTGAYAAINNRFALYLREKYPEVRYLNREEDMGIPGLRKAKESYHPHHRVEKWWARLKEQCDEE